MRISSLCLLALCMVAACMPKIMPQASTETVKDAKATDISSKTKEMQPYTGYFTFYWDEKAGKIWLEIDKWDSEFLYVNALAAGVGNNDLGLDRGQLGRERVVKFIRSGPKVLLIQPNYAYRAVSDNVKERNSVEEAFAQSVLYGFKAEAETDGKVLIDLTDFLLRDAHGIGQRLSETEQGTFKADASRSAIHLPRTKNFPQNSEFEAIVTLTEQSGKRIGKDLASVTPTPDAVTVRMHHSFVQLPDDGYEPRAFDPRAGYFFISYQDYATPIVQPLTKRFIARHRLKKKDPSAALSEPVEPIIYYLDPGAPEPVRSALLEGARWWNQAFEAAGYQNAFQVEILPDSADPLDIRYNVIQWVHRSTRGWSYGASVTDPRTGEIIKGHVSLGSLRVRQDLLIAEGLLAPYAVGTEEPTEAMEMALARLRQLSAHEVGHTLGLAHNYAASYNSRASVMDYPHPFIKMDAEGNIDLSDAYDTGIGEWDKTAIAYGYSDFAPETDEKPALENILKQAIDTGLLFITDQDARPQGGAHPVAHLWDNAQNAAAELNRIMDIREAVLQNFSEKQIPDGAPLSTVEEVLVPIYLLHRYQVEAATKMIGGLDYSYSLRGDNQLTTAMLSPAIQNDAIEAVISTIRPEALTLPEQVLNLLQPRAFGYPRSRETFKSRTGVTFDALGAAETAASMALSLLFHPERANRLVAHKAMQPDQPGLQTVLKAAMQATWKAAPRTGYERQIQYINNSLLLDELLQLARDSRATEQVRALVHSEILALQKYLQLLKNRGTEQDQAHYIYALAEIDQYLENPQEIKVNTPLSPPDGSPIGSRTIYCGEEY